MYEVLVSYDGDSFKITDSPVSLSAAYAAIESNHAETDADFRKILAKASLAGLRDEVCRRISEGELYSIVSIETGEVVRTVMVKF